MKKYILSLFLFLGTFTYSQKLLIIANPISHKGYLTQKVNRLGLGCEVFENELTFQNSDFGLEIKRILPTLREMYTSIEIVYLHKSLDTTLTSNKLYGILEKYENYDVYFLDHFSEIKMFGLPTHEFIKTIQHANNLNIFLGTCYGKKLVDRLHYHNSKIHCTDEKYYGFDIINKQFNLKLIYD